MQYNPYEYMLHIRNNRVLFQYLEVSAVNFDEEHGWTITGQTKEGKTEIYEISSGVLRFTLPISVPSFVNMDMIHKILEGLQGTVEGLITAAEDEDGIFIEYHLHSTTDDESLDKALLKFVQERAEINKGFDSLAEEYKRMERAMGSISEGIAAMMNKPQAPNSSTDKIPSNEDDLSSLWNDMKDIDTKDDDEGLDDIGSTAPAE